jgi:hypothetical protein
MKIYEHFMNLLDLPVEIVIEEANHKFSDTIMRINGKLWWIEGIRNNSIEVCEDPREDEYETLTSAKVKSIKPWIPLTGIYIFRDNPLYLRRIVKRQWKKSFCWNQYETPADAKYYTIHQIDGQEPMYCYIDRKKKVMMYQNYKIATKVGDAWVIHDKIFEIEYNKLLEKEKQYGDPVDVRRYVHIS